ncbi:MAG TPA: hypothetical protein VFS21_05350 [Roseiflexaceae bacterium]|nr:hypothetical protein [Roseiflexaceae bacterium]
MESSSNSKITIYAQPSEYHGAQGLKGYTKIEATKYKINSTEPKSGTISFIRKNKRKEETLLYRASG